VFKGTPRICAEYEEILQNRETPKMYLEQEINATLSLLLTSTEARHNIKNGGLQEIEQAFLAS
jgi:hypothetical protein